MSSELLNIWKLTQLKDVTSSDETSAPGERVFQTITNQLEIMGNPNRVAYGGCAFAISLAAAFVSLDGRDMAPYSMLAHFLGGSDAGKPLRARVRTLRETRTFVTRSVLITQEQKDGSWRGTLSATIDFIQPTERKSAATLLEYSVAPRYKKHKPEDLPDRDAWLAQALREGRFTERHADAFTKMFSTMPRYAETRSPPDSMMVQKLWALQPEAKTTQDELPITDRYSVEYFRAIDDLAELNKQRGEGIPLSLRGLTACWACFYADGALAFLPLVHSGGIASDPYGFQSTTAVSTLECAIRWHTEEMDSAQWHFREFQTLSGNHERSFTETRIFDQNDRLAMTVSQQSVLRGKVKARM